MKNKTILITGATGSFGNALLQQLEDSGVDEIRLFSRDEQKQNDMRRHYSENRPTLAEKLRFYIGDIRDKESLYKPLYGADCVFHAAALKQVPSCEFFPAEAVKTNVLGTENLIGAAVETGVKRLVCLSTDKAVYPVNAMGLSKALMEKVAAANAAYAASRGTSVCVTRYGNVMCSRGSVIPLFVSQIKNGQPLTVTDGTMTRFIMSLEEAIELVLYALEYANGGDTFVYKAPACTVGTLAQAVKEIFKADNEIKQIGVRRGEKRHEILLSAEELARSADEGAYYRIPIAGDGNNYTEYLSEGDRAVSEYRDYCSRDCVIEDVEAVKEKLLRTGFIKNIYLK